jgi:hypothetical protein
MRAKLSKLFTTCGIFKGFYLGELDKVFTMPDGRNRQWMDIFALWLRKRTLSVTAGLKNTCFE